MKMIKQMKNKKWTSENIPDLTGKIIIVTGANSGTGFIVTRNFVSKNAQVIMACRNMEKAEEAKSFIKKEYPEAQLKTMQLDLADLSSVKNFVEEFKKHFSKLDILCNNAGLMVPPYSETKDSFELQIGTNYLGHFALTSLLFESLKKSDDARIVTMSSVVHRFGKINLEDLNWKKRKYKKLRAYGQSKLADLMFAYELQRKLKQLGITNIKSVASHPGWSSTNLQKYAWYLRAGNKILSQSPEIGALSMLYAATSEDIEGGEYIGPNKFFGFKGYPRKVKSTKASKDEEVAKKLWNLSEDLTAISFKF